jgi:hypothetical protein
MAPAETNMLLSEVFGESYRDPGRPARLQASSGTEDITRHSRDYRPSRSVSAIVASAAAVIHTGTSTIARCRARCAA